MRKDREKKRNSSTKWLIIFLSAVERSKKKKKRREKIKKSVEYFYLFVTLNISRYWQAYVIKNFFFPKKKPKKFRTKRITNYFFQLPCCKVHPFIASFLPSFIQHFVFYFLCFSFFFFWQEEKEFSIM